MLKIYLTFNRERLKQSELSIIQREECTKNNGRTEKNSTASRAQSVVNFNKDVPVTTDPNLVMMLMSNGNKKLTKTTSIKISSVVGKSNRGIIPKGSFAACVQSMVDKAEFDKKFGGNVGARVEVLQREIITVESAKSLQKQEALQHNGKVQKGSIASLAQSAIYKMQQEKLKEVEKSLATPHRKKHRKRGKANKSRAKIAASSFIEETEDTTNALNTMTTREPLYE